MLTVCSYVTAIHYNSIRPAIKQDERGNKADTPLFLQTGRPCLTAGRTKWLKKSTHIKSTEKIVVLLGALMPIIETEY